MTKPEIFKKTPEQWLEELGRSQVAHFDINDTEPLTNPPKRIISITETIDNFVSSGGLDTLLNLEGDFEFTTETGYRCKNALVRFTYTEDNYHDILDDLEVCRSRWDGVCLMTIDKQDGKYTMTLYG